MNLKQCLQAITDTGVSVYGDIKWRGNCNVEDADLASFFAWVRFNYPDYHDLIFHPENEMQVNGGSSFSYHSKSVNKGRLDGVADVVCLPIRSGAPAFIMELKRLDIGKSLAGEKRQLHMIKQLSRLESQFNHGAFACICLGLDNAKQAFDEYVRKYGTAKESPGTARRNA